MHVFRPLPRMHVPGTDLWLVVSHPRKIAFTVMAHEDRERGINTGLCHLWLLPVLSGFTSVYKTDDDLTQPVLNRPRLGEPCFCDSSGPFFSIYSKAAEEEDNKMVERWQKDADGILIFVRPRASALCIISSWHTIDRSILCCSRRTPCCDCPGPQTKQPGYFCILSWKHL